MEVYLIQNEETLRVKIGFSSNVKKRRYFLQTASAENLKILATFESKYATKIETILHRTHHDKRLNGEWFEYISPEEFLKDCQKIHNNLKMLDDNKISDRTFF